MSKELKIKGALTKDYQQLYIDDTPTGIEINNDGKVRIKNLVVKETSALSNENLRIIKGEDYFTANSSVNPHKSAIRIDGDLVIDADGSIWFDGASDGGFFFTNGNEYLYTFKIDTDNREISFHDSTVVADLFKIAVATNGATTISTTDYAAFGVHQAGHLTLDADGRIDIDSHIGIINLKDSDTTFGVLTASSVTLPGSTLILYENAGASTDDWFALQTAANGETYLKTQDAGGTVGHLHLIPDGDLKLDPVSQKIIINTTDKLYFDGGTHTSIDEESADRLRFTVGADEMLILDKIADTITIGASNWKACTASGATLTEFSAANSAYAGMILGYTQVGADVADDSYALTTAYIVFDSDLAVAFKTPPSEKVEITATFTYKQGSAGRNIFASISDNATYASSTLYHPLALENAVTVDAERGGQGVVTMSWYLKSNHLEAIGSSNTIYFAAKCNSTAGIPTLYWGGDATDEYQNFVMKAIALPAS